MSSSQNGWPVDTTGGRQDRGDIYPGVAVPNGVLEGDVATVLRWVARRWHTDVEPLRAGTCWGWFVKKIEGGTSISNHASGTAIDLNADRHPMGVTASANMSARQIAACRKIVADSRGVVRWGGDFSRPDPMHWEINAKPAAVAAFADTLRMPGEGDDMFPHEGDEGEGVKYWQMVLAKLGRYDGAIDGEWGKKTTAAINADRAARGEGPHVQVTAWHALQMQRDYFTR